METTIQPMRSPYKNLGQVALSFAGTLTPTDFDGPAPPTLRGEGRAAQGFKPNKVIAEVVALTAHAGPGPDRTIAHVITGEAMGDILLVGAQFDETACWPAKDPSKGDCCEECYASRTGGAISFAVFAPDSLGCGVSWPPIQEKVSAEIVIGKEFFDAVAASCLRGQPDNLPSGYDPHPKRMDVSVRLMWVGPALR